MYSKRSRKLLFLGNSLHRIYYIPHTLNMRIQKYLSEQKILSRRETEEYIKKGLIACNGEIVRDLGRQIDPAKDKITILQSPEQKSASKTTVVVHKPRGIVSSKIKNEGKTIFELLPQFAHLNTVGRLDKESEGLLLLSNDGTITSAVTSDKHIIEKEYEVTVREKIENWKIKRMERGMKLEDSDAFGRSSDPKRLRSVTTLPAKAELLSPHTFRIILKEGRKHQIRRMAANVQLTITSLIRTRIGTIKIAGLKVGSARPLTPKEITSLKLK